DQLTWLATCCESTNNVISFIFISFVIRRPVMTSSNSASLLVDLNSNFRAPTHLNHGVRKDLLYRISLMIREFRAFTLIFLSIFLSASKILLMRYSTIGVIQLFSSLMVAAATCFS
nr:hypothetical protein [Tanacetum cinerariifolium]